MNIKIHGYWPYSEAHDSGLLSGFSQGHRSKVGITVGMTPGLHPNLQLRVEKDQDALQVSVYDQRAASEVPWSFCSIKRQRTLGEKQPHPFPCLTELGVVDWSDRRPGITHAVRRRKALGVSGEEFRGMHGATVGRAQKWRPSRWLIHRGERGTV